MRNLFTIAVAVGLLVAALAGPASASEATVQKGETSFPADYEIWLCNGDLVKIEGTFVIKWTSVVNDNGRHYHQLTRLEDRIEGHSLLTGQRYRLIHQAPITSQSMANGTTVEQLLSANFNFIAQGPGPEHGAVSISHARHRDGSGSSVVHHCKE